MCKTTASHLGSEKQGTESEDCGHIDDGEKQFVGFHDALCLLWDSPLSFARLVFTFQNGHQRCGYHEQHTPKKQEIYKK